MAIQRLYETTFILRPDLDDPQVEAIQELIKDQLSKSKAPQVRWETWGKRKLAYQINKFSKGLYFYVLYLADKDVVGKLELTMRHHEDILRWLSVSVIDEVDTDAFEFDTWANRSTPLYYDKESDTRSDSRPSSDSSSDANKKSDASEAKPVGKVDASDDAAENKDTNDETPVEAAEETADAEA